MNKPHHPDNVSRLSAAARKAARARNWNVVRDCAREILRHDKRNAEGWFLNGLLLAGTGQYQQAVAAFTAAIGYDAQRYDAAIELADMCLYFLRHAEALSLLQRYTAALDNSPYYLDKAANIYTRLALHDKAWPLYRRANQLQPEIDHLQANLAACSVLVGKVDLARRIYQALLKRHPHHQKFHYELSKVARATDPAHVEQMEAVLESTRLPPEKNIFLYYALGKELEDLERWDEAFDYYRQGGDAAAAQAHAAGYDVGEDVSLMDKIIEVCTPEWIAAGAERFIPDNNDPTPIFVVGLPRTGTTLTERILSSHSRVESADESFFLHIVIKRVSGFGTQADMSPEIIEAAAGKDIDRVARGYIDAIDYRLNGKPMFVEKYPENFLYLGFIARAWPEARIVHLRRNPMDACFAMYKQSYFRQAYSLDDLARYYIAYERLYQYWRDTLGDRLVAVRYEDLVSDTEAQTRSLLDRLGLEFEPACLEFHLNKAPSATASTVQVREKAHTRSIGKWKRWEQQLQPLRERLEAAGIAVE